MKKRLKKQPLVLLLALLLIFNPSFAGYAFSETSGSANVAVAEDNESATVTNENEANVENNADVEANTGENEISPEESVGIGEERGEEVDGEGGGEGGEGESSLASESEFEEQEELEGEEENSEGENEEAEALTDGEEEGVTAVNEETPSDSESTASALLEEITEVTNENEAEVENNTNTAAQTGENQASGDDFQINTGEAEAQTDAANVVNTNIVGEDFWQVIVNQFEDSQDNLDLSSIEGIENLSPEFISILAANLDTGSDSTNLALAFYLSLFAVYNQNTATLTNNIDLLASSGTNQVTGSDGTIQTGDAEALLNLFNMANTNLIGSDWFFGIINLFGELEGDIILPNEWLFLGEEGTGGDASVVAANVNPGEGSNNQAIAGSNEALNVCNENEADLTNNVSVLANSGRNEIAGTGEIETGDADANLNLFNMVNTNIVGSRWVLLVINNFDEWVGEILNWWGNALSIDNTTLIWVQLPPLDENSGGATMALNANTGENSDNLALAQSQNLTTVENHNVATVENNVSVVADTGNNQIEGSSASIQTGNAQASANIFNFFNTNIFGNNWYFCMINIFDRFIGNVVFHRETPEETPEETPAPSASADSGTGGVSDSACHDQPPGGAPKLLSAVAGENSVTLTWEKASDPVSYYLVAYGEEPGNYLYGNPNIGGPETTSFTINDLSGGKTYYFVVRAGNGCAPGPFSNELSATPYGAVLGAETADVGLIDAQAAEGEVIGGATGVQTRQIPWWLIFSLGGGSLLGAVLRGVYLFLRRG